MAQDVKAFGRTRKVNEGVDAEALGNSDLQITLSQQLEQLIAHGAAPYQEIVRVGRSFQVHTATAIAGIVAIPTTAALLQLYNGEADGGLSYIIDWVAAVGAAKSAAAGQQQLIGCLGQVREAIPTDAALTITKMNGTGGVSTKARTVLNGTALPAGTGLAVNWFPIGPSVGNPGAAATPGNGLWHPVDGRIIVPPGRFLGRNWDKQRA